MNNQFSIIYILAALATCFLSGSVIANETKSALNEKVYVDISVGITRFDLPGYQDGFGVVGLSPVSGPFFDKAEQQNGQSIALVTGILTDYRIDALDSNVFFEGSVFYSHDNKQFESTLGPDGDGNSIRFALFNGANGYNSSNADPLNYKLRATLDYYDVNINIGVETKKSGWTIKTSVGPQFLKLNQEYRLQGTNLVNSASFYNREESLDALYRGIRLALSTSKDLSTKWSVDGGVGLSALAMRSRFRGVDEHYTTSGSSLSYQLNDSTYGIDLTIGARYRFTPSTSLGVNFGASYLDKVPKIVHPTGSTSFATFVPGFLDTDHMLTRTISMELKMLF